MEMLETSKTILNPNYKVALCKNGKDYLLFEEVLGALVAAHQLIQSQDE